MRRCAPILLCLGHAAPGICTLTRAAPTTPIQDGSMLEHSVRSVFSQPFTSRMLDLGARGHRHGVAPPSSPRGGWVRPTSWHLSASRKGIASWSCVRLTHDMLLGHHPPPPTPYFMRLWIGGREGRGAGWQGIQVCFVGGIHARLVVHRFVWAWLCPRLDKWAGGSTLVSIGLFVSLMPLRFKNTREYPVAARRESPPSIPPSIGGSRCS